MSANDNHAPGRPLGPVRLLLTKAAVALVTVVLGTLAVAVGVASQRGAARVVHLWGRLLLGLIGVRVTVEGLAELDLDRRYVVMANHESSLDIPALLTALPAALEVRFLARKDLFGVPFLGWAMTSAGFVPVDRDDRSTAPAMLARTLGEVRRGGSPLIFPEQTFTRDGRLLPFARGGFLVALKAGLPILPVGLEGPRLVMPPGEGVVRPRPVTVRIGRPVPTESLGVSRRGELIRQVRGEIDRLRGPVGHLRDEP